MRWLTEWWLIDVDVRKEALRGWVIGVKEEDVSEARWRFNWTRGTARRSSSGSEELRAWRGSTRGDLVAPGGGQRRKAMAAGLVGEELSGGNRAAVMLSALGGNGEEGVEWLCCAQGKGRV